MIRDINKEAFSQLIKVGIGMIPGWGILLNGLIDSRSTIKQERLNNFIKVIKKYLEEHSDYNLDKIDKEELGDIFELILTKVIKTKSENKLEYYRNLLLSGSINNSYKFEKNKYYIELLDRMSISDIHFLNSLKTTGNYLKHLIQELNDLEKEIESLKKIGEIEYSRYREGYANNYEPNRKKESEVHKDLIIKNSIINATQDDLLRKITEDKVEESILLSKLQQEGLIVKNSRKETSLTTIDTYNLTEMGLDFLNYIALN